MKKCPICNQEMITVINTGLPMWLCSDEECNCIDGFFANFMEYLPFNGFFFMYKGNYFIALFRWLVG